MSTVFISYSHKDVPLREELESHLRILALNDDDVKLEVWSDERLTAGDRWEATIDAIMERASIALLILTKHFLSSEFIRKKELPYLEARARQHALTIIPILAERCTFDLVPALSARQLHPTSGRPLQSLSSHERNEELTKLLYQIRKLLTNGSAPIGELPPEDMELPIDGELEDSGRVVVPILGDSATLQVSLRHHRAAQYYDAEVRYSDPQRPRNDRELTSSVHLGPSLVGSPVDWIAYAAELERCLFPVGTSQEVVKKAIADAKGRTLTLRVSIDPTAGDLHCVRWEALPFAPLFAAASEPAEIVFTRHVSPGEETWSKPRIRSWPKAGVLLLDYRLQPRPEEHEACAVRFEALGLECTRLAADSPMAALDSIEAVIALVATDLTADAFAPSLSWPDDQGRAVLRPAEDALKAFRRHLGGVQVVILATSSAAGEAGEPAGWGQGALTLAADLAEAGFCAVVTHAGLDAVHWQRFLELFLAALQRTGNVDGAAHEARAGLPAEEAWKPAVFTRLRTGRIWRQPRFVGKGESSWDLIVERTRERSVIPILGPGVSDYLLRSREEIAQEMADRCHFPLARSERSKLRKVAQYIATTQEPARPIRQFQEAVRSYITERHGGSIEGLSRGAGGEDPGRERRLDEDLERIWRDALSKRADDPYQLVARMKACVYLTTAFHTFLSLAVRDHLRNGAGEHTGPRDRILSLDHGILDAEADCDELGLKLDWQQPLVYYLFGRVDHPKSLVLTEDDHFRFLLDFKEQWRSLPETVVERFSDSALLFLGFDLNGWDFRAIFRAILELEGSQQLRKIPHVAVQVNPDDDRLADPERTQAYLVEYFRQISEKPLVFLGSTHDFLSELDRRCNR